LTTRPDEIFFCREEDRFETVRAAVAHDAAKGALRRPSVRLLVVRQTVEIPLHGERRAQTRDEPLLARRESRGGSASWL